MGGQVPHNVHVVPEQPEIHTRDVNVEDLPELAGVHQALDVPDGIRVQKRVAHHQNPVLLLGEIQHGNAKAQVINYWYRSRNYINDWLQRFRDFLDFRYDRADRFINVGANIQLNIPEFNQ